MSYSSIGVKNSIASMPQRENNVLPALPVLFLHIAVVRRQEKGRRKREKTG